MGIASIFQYGIPLGRKQLRLFGDWVVLILILCGMRMGTPHEKHRVL